MRKLWATVVVTLLVTFASARAEPSELTGVNEPPAEVVVNHEPPVVHNRTFDPKNPPAEMPPLKPGEAAVTESGYSCATAVEVFVVSQQPLGAAACRATVRVGSVTATLRLEITVWVPQGGAHKLTAHEQGHRTIEERYYAGAKDVAERLCRDMIGREFTAEAADCDAAVQAASRNAANQLNGQYLAAIQYPAARAGVLYDELTDHGRNDLGEAKAIELAMKKQREEQRAPAATQPAAS